MTEEMLRVKFSAEALANIEEAGVAVERDLADVLLGRWTRETLLEHCLRGADEDRVLGWREYVDTLFDFAESQGGE